MTALIEAGLLIDVGWTKYSTSRKLEVGWLASRVVQITGVALNNSGQQAQILAVTQNPCFSLGVLSPSICIVYSNSWRWPIRKTKW